MYPYRVFLSYSYSERDLAMRVVATLRDMGFVLAWDDAPMPGRPFPDEIKKQIACSHLFVPLLTSESIHKPWVHQETGYAMGVGVPIFPVVFGDVVPDALINQLQAVRIQSDITDLKRLLPENRIRARLDEAARAGSPTFESVEYPERRAQAIALNSGKALELGGGRIRQSGAITSFGLPDLPPSHPIWRQRDGDRQRSDFLYEQLYEERVVLGELAAAHGCSLVIDPGVPLETYGQNARKLRLQTLKTFLLDERTYPDVQVVARERADVGNLLIVGDWFCAESKTPAKGGYRQTLFSWHAPTVLARIREFDSRFESAIGGRSRYDAIARIEREIGATGAV